MNRYQILVSSSLCLIAGTASALHAQTVTATSVPARADEAIVLSPFNVQIDKDSGYEASNTLAGSRLNTPIKDLGGAISVYTKEFLSDINATSVNDLLIYSVGTEAAGPGGNFSAGAGADITSTAVVGDGIRNNPQSGTRTRGLSSPTFTRQFFISEVQIDSYNTEAITVNRGPNAILFGVASPAGVVDTTLLQANVSRNIDNTEFRYGNNDSTRFTADINRVLIPNVLAIRLDGLEDNNRFDQRPSFETKERLYGALTYKPFASTIFHGNFEAGHTSANREMTVLPFDATQPWLSDSRQAFDWKTYDNPATPVTKVPYGNYDIGQVQIFNTFIFPVASPYQNNAAISTGFRSAPAFTASTGNNALAVNAIRQNLVDPNFNPFPSHAGQVFLETRNIAEMPAAYFPGGKLPAGQKYQGFTDYSAFDFRNQMMDESGRQSDTFRTYTLTFEQRAWEDRIGVEGVFYAQEYESRNRNNFLSTQGNANAIRIDPNLYLPDGTPNPNVGRPYVDGGQDIYNQSRTNREAMRLTAFLRYDFKDLSPRLGKWLGQHTVTGLEEKVRRDQLGVQSKFAYFGPNDDFASANPYDFNRLSRLIAYVGPSVIGNTNPLKLQAITMSPIADGTPANATVFLAPAGSPAQATEVTNAYNLRQIFRNGAYSRDLERSNAANLMSYWLDDLVVTNFGVRHDNDYFVQNTIDNSYTASGLANVYKVNRNFNEFVLPETPRYNAGGQTTSESVVVRWPQDLYRLPQGMDVSVFYDSSQNFTPNGSNTDAYGNLLPSPKGVTHETGANFSFLNNRFSLRFNHYETKVANASFGRTSPLSQMINNVILQTTSAWATEVNVHPNASRQADINLMLSALPSNFSQIYNLQYTGSAAAGNAALTNAQIPGYSDTADYVAKGNELELVYNPTRNWRILFNVAQDQTVLSNIAPVTRELVARMTPVLNQLANRPKGTALPSYVFPTDANGNVTSLDAGAGETTLGQYVFANVTVPLATLVAEEGVSSPEVRKYRANLVTNYDFDRSWLKGFGVGTGLRWQDKLGIGYPTSYTSTGSVFIDINHPYYSPAVTNIDGWISYRHKLWNSRIDWKIQLNASNLFASDETIPITVQPNGAPASVRLPPEKRWFVSNTFSF